MEADETIESTTVEHMNAIPEEYRKEAALVVLAGNMLKAAGLHAVISATRIGEEGSPIHSSYFIDTDDPTLGDLESETVLVLSLGTAIHKAWFKHLARRATSDIANSATPEKE